MKITNTVIFSLIGLFLAAPNSLLAASDGVCPDGGSLENECLSIANRLPMNAIQSVGSHNSYKLAIPAPELELIRAYNERSAITLDYSHLSLTEQLNLGLRQLELDIVYDPEGGRFAHPLLPAQTRNAPGALPYNNEHMFAPGFKVLHSQDIDVRSNCDTWIICLTEIYTWSKANPNHVPILIMFNAKTGGSAYPGVNPALPFDEAAFSALDAEIFSVFAPDDLITPDLVRGGAATLREGVLSGGWPTLEAARGKVFFALDEGEEKVNLYLRGNPSLQGLPVFVNSVDEQADHAAYFTINNPIADQSRIQAAVKAGFIVRTRADADTREARENSTVRREAAFLSGAQYISTDYYFPRKEFSNYSVSLPGHVAARCNPILVEGPCSR